MIIASGDPSISYEVLLEAHERDVTRVLDLLVRHKLTGSSDKATIAVSEVVFAGHVVGNGQRKPIPGKVAAIEHWEKPKTVYSHPPATGGIRLDGVVAADVGDAIRIDHLRKIKIPYYDGNPSNLDDFILDWEDFAKEVVGEMKGAPRDKWVCWTFPHRLAQDLKEELID